MMKRYNVTFVIDACTITTTVEFDEPMSKRQIIMYAADLINADLMLQMDVMDQALDTIVEEL
jgi:hypothetical protein